MKIYYLLVFFFSFPGLSSGQVALPDSVCCEQVEKIDSTGNLKQLRLSQNLTTQEVAAKLGITVKEYYLLEKKGIWPDKTILNELLELFQCGLAFDKDRRLYLKPK
jgi:DNA-binding XRE family transcriptional regulator